MRRLLSLLAPLVALILLLGACGTDDGGNEESSAPGTDVPTETAEDLPRIVVTTSILGDITENVVHDLAEVEVIMPPGSDPHDFEPSAQQIALLGEADLVIANGLLLEEGLIGPLENAAADGVPVVEVAPALSPIPFAGGMGHSHDHNDDGHSHDDDGHSHDDDGHSHDDDGHSHDDDGHSHDEQAAPAATLTAASQGDDHDHDHGDEDPHVWMDVDRMAAAAQLIADEVAEHTDIDAAVLEENADAYAAELAELDEEIQAILEPIPADRRLLVTNHDSLGYFADRYGFEVVGTVIPSGSTLAEPGAADIVALVELIEELDIQAIFAENISSTDLAEMLAGEVDHDVVVVELATDSLGEPGTPADTYIGMMRSNAELIAEALS